MNNTQNNNLLETVVYSNLESSKSQVLLDNKGKAGIYQWTHKESGKIYIGSAADLSIRLGKYFSKNYLNRDKSMYICNALLLHGHSAFTLTILEYINISNLSKAEARKLILSREQYYLDDFRKRELPMYNILKTAGSLLGFKHSEENIILISTKTREALSDPEIRAKIKGTSKSEEHRAKISEAKKGIPHNAETKAKIGIAHKDKVTSPETKAKMSKAHKGKELPLEHRTKISAAQKGKKFSPEHRMKISVAKGGGTIFVYDTNGSFVNSFYSIRKAAEFFNCSHATIYRHIKSSKLFQDKWILETLAKKSTND